MKQKLSLLIVLPVVPKHHTHALHDPPHPTRLDNHNRPHHGVKLVVPTKADYEAQAKKDGKLLSKGLYRNGANTLSATTSRRISRASRSS